MMTMMTKMMIWLFPTFQHPTQMYTLGTIRGICSIQDATQTQQHIQQKQS
jgi:hypothetical protein